MSGILMKTNPERLLPGKGGSAEAVLLGELSHNLRTPMNAILGFAALAEAHLDNPGVVRDYLEKIAASGSLLLEFINELLDGSRGEAGKTLPDAQASRDGVSTPLDGVRALVVDDNGLNREIAAALLEDMGIRSEEAADGAAAVEMLEKAAPGYYDLILMDVRMPRMDGHEATRRIRRLAEPQKAGIPIIALTANTFPEDRQAALRAGMDAFLGKPIDPKLLRQTIEKILKHK